MKKIIIILLAIGLTISCSEETGIKTNSTGQKNTYEAAVERTKDYAFNLEFDIDYMIKKGLPDKKFLAEYLGLYLKLYKAASSKSEKEEIKEQLEPYYKKTLEASYHNLGTINDKLFKKNSMSYMRIMWLLNELGFNIDLYKEELAKVQVRMNKHLVRRGMWQKAVFETYYSYFNIEKPVFIKHAYKYKGPIQKQKPIKYYSLSKAYIITHFVFASYDYGNRIEQTRFNEKDLKYLAMILPQIIAKFEKVNNDDIVAELLTCLVFIGETETDSFKKSYARLLSRQNKDGSFGSYENYRAKLGADVDFRVYLHTTLVGIEVFIENEFRKNK